MTSFTKTCLVLLIVIPGLLYLAVALYIAKHAELDDKKPSDVILVLGAKGKTNGHYNPCLKSRVEQGVKLYKEHYAPLLLFTGGRNKKEASEAQTMKEIALSLGVPARAILLETNAKTTYENLLFSKKMIEDRHLQSIIIVTEAFHSPRARLVAQKLGLIAVSSPTVISNCWNKEKYFTYNFLREALAIIVYKARGQL